ncbi:MAG: hypothetical protein HLUCCA08_06000 [Rhodobacteraceae bacterium HLUCCA08]|nr:MAG: hypothetical protein HLUCCA08_06000 [Rhodobacteraceae bacterium HLUCCA08]
MRPVRALCLALALSPAPLAAQTAPTIDGQRTVTPDEFDAITEGRTIGWRYPNGAVGVEYYMANRQVLWQVDRDECTAGEWFAQGDAICFVYGPDDVPGCWFVYERDGKLIVNDVDAPMVELVEKGDAAPLVCAGPGA